MPRIYTSRSDPVDFCKECFPNEAEAEERFAELGDGPDGRGNCFDYESAHPPYPDAECPDSAYTCEDCHKHLTPEDD